MRKMMYWISSKKKKPTLGMEIVAKYDGGKKEVVFCDSKVIGNIQKTEIDFEWFELPKARKK